MALKTDKEGTPTLLLGKSPFVYAALSFKGFEKSFCNDKTLIPPETNQGLLEFCAIANVATNNINSRLSAVFFMLKNIKFLFCFNLTKRQKCISINYIEMQIYKKKYLCC